MPVGNLPGWRQILADDFTGSALGPHWYAYTGAPEGDSGGYFSPSHVSVGGGMLTIGAWQEAAHQGLYVTGGIGTRSTLSQTYGRYEVRFRAQLGTGIAYTVLLWPSSNVFPPEIDFAEDNGKKRDRLFTTMHSADGTRQTEHEIAGDFTQWHTAGIQWTHNKIVYTLDGRSWASISNDKVPSQPMDLAIQTQAWFCGQGWEACPGSTTPARVNLQVDWAVAYAPTK